MKQLYLLLLSAIIFLSCKKDDVDHAIQESSHLPSVLKKPAGGGGGGGTGGSSVFQWQKCFGTRGYEHGYAMARNSKGYMIAGEQTGNNQSAKGYVTFYNVTAGQDLTTVFDGNNVRGVVSDGNDGFVVVSRTTDAAVQGSYNDGAGDIMLLFFNSDGSLVNKRAIGLPGTQTPMTIIRTTDGGYAISGYASAYLFLKVDQNGAFQWEAEQPYGEYKVLFGYSIVETDNAFIAAGNSMDVNYNHDVLLLSIDKSSHEVSLNFFGTPDSEEFGFGIAANTNGDFLVTGRKDNQVFAQKFDAQLNALNSRTYVGGTGWSVVAVNSEWFIAGVDNNTSTNAVLVRLDSDLNLAAINGVVSLGGTNDDDARQVIQDGDGFAFAGTTASKSGVVAGNHGNIDQWLVKVKY